MHSSAQYLHQLFHPHEMTEYIGAPDMFPKKTAITRITQQSSLTSSVLNGDIICTISPWCVATSLASAAPVYDGRNLMATARDGINPGISVNDIPSVAWSIGTYLWSTTLGFNLANYASFFRLLSFEVTITYTGAPLYASGVGMLSFYNSNIARQTVTGQNEVAPAWTMGQDTPFYAKGTAQSTFIGHWFPQTQNEFVMISIGPNPSAVDPESFAFPQTDEMGSFVFLATGLPKNTLVYDVSFTALVEYIPRLSLADAIPAVIHPFVPFESTMESLWSQISKNPKLITCQKEQKRQIATDTSKTVSEGTGYTLRRITDS